MALVEKCKDFLPKFFPYAVYSEMGLGWVGVTEDAPEWAKEDFKKWKAKQEECKKTLEKL